MAKEKAPTLSEMLERKRLQQEEAKDLERSIQIAQIETIQEIIDAWSDPAVVAAIKLTGSKIELLTDHQQAQAQNLVSVPENSLNFLQERLAAIVAIKEPAQET